MVEFFSCLFSLHSPRPSSVPGSIEDREHPLASRWKGCSAAFGLVIRNPRVVKICTCCKLPSSTLTFVSLNGHGKAQRNSIEHGRDHIPRSPSLARLVCSVAERYERACTTKREAAKQHWMASPSPTGGPHTSAANEWFHEERQPTATLFRCNPLSLS